LVLFRVLTSIKWVYPKLEYILMMKVLVNRVALVIHSHLFYEIFFNGIQLLHNR
jgi:hypothetical protein